MLQSGAVLPVDEHVETVPVDLYLKRRRLLIEDDGNLREGDVERLPPRPHVLAVQNKLTVALVLTRVEVEEDRVEITRSYGQESLLEAKDSRCNH